MSPYCYNCPLRYRFGGCAVKTAIERAITAQDPEVAIQYVRLTFQESCKEVEKLIKEAGWE